MNWSYETYKSMYRQGFLTRESLGKGRSDFQEVEVIDTEGFGRVLLNDGFVMTTTLDERIYHEMLAHVPLLVHPNPRRVLIIGGGDGGTAREAVRHANVDVDLVEIDPLVIELARAHLTETACGLNHERVNVFVQDGLEFVRNTTQTYDVVLVDSTEPFGPAESLFNLDFYRDVHRCLSTDGIVVAQGDNPFFAKDTQQGLLKTMSDVFAKVSVYNYTNFTYPGGAWSFFAASKTGLDLSEPQSSLDGPMFYYTPQVHRAAFALPAYQRQSLGL